MAKWLRIALFIALAIFGAALWGFIAVWLGIPPVVIGLGAVIIGATMFTLAFRSKNSN